MKVRFTLFTAILLTVCFYQTATAAILYGHAHAYADAADYGRLYRIDTLSQTVTPLGVDTDRTYAPEIQMDPSEDRIYVSTVGATWNVFPNAGSLFIADPATGNTMDTLALTSYPDGTDTATALEFVGGVLYGSFHESGPESDDGILGTINLATGEITAIGAMTPMDKPAGGMHYHDGTMYAVGATDSDNCFLFTINLATGAATEVAEVTLNGQLVQSLTALAYGDDKMYTFISRGTNLYSLDLETGVLTLEFDTGVYLASLTSGPLVQSAAVPATSTIAIIVLAGLVLLLVRRRLVV